MKRLEQQNSIAVYVLMRRSEAIKLGNRVRRWVSQNEKLRRRTPGQDRTVQAVAGIYDILVYPRDFTWMNIPAYNQPLDDFLRMASTRLKKARKPA